MTCKERVLCALTGGQPDRVPYCEVGIDEPIACRLLDEEVPTDRYWEAGEYIQRQIEREKSLSRMLGRDNINYSFRPPIPAHKHVGKDNILFYGEGMVKSESELDLIQLPDPYDDRLYEPAIEFVKRKEDFAACAVCRLGLSPTYLCMGIEAFCTALYDEPKLVDEVLLRYTDWSAAVVERVCALGFDFMWMADDIAFKTGPLISPDMFRGHILPRIRRVAQKISIPWIYHSDGDLTLLLDDLLTLGMSALHPIEPEAMDIVSLRQRLGKRICLVGNVSVHTLAEGTPKQVASEVKRLLQQVAPSGAYILSSGNTLTSYCKPENILAMVETLKEYGEYPIHIPR